MSVRLINSRFILGALLAGCTLLSPGRAKAAGPTLSAGLGFEVATGSYGTGTRTDSIYAPFTAAMSTERMGFSLEIPYVYQSSSSVNTGLFAGPGGQMMAAAKKATPAMTGSAMGNGPTSTATAGNQHRSQSGLGDIIAKGAYILVPGGNAMPRVTPYVQVKFPTGDADSALGTGTFSEGGFLELSKQMGSWYSFAEAGYVFQGKSAVLPLKNYFSYDAGLGHTIGEKFLPMAIIKGSTAPVAGSSDLLEVRMKLKFQATTHAGCEGYLAKGITTNSPDYGGGLAVFYDF